MAIISEHLCSLIDDLNEGPSDRSRRDINEWFAYGELTHSRVLLT